MIRLISLFLLLLLASTVCSGQEKKEEENPGRDFTKLTFNFFDPADRVTAIFFPLSIVVADTAFVLRYVLMLAVSGWNNAAACDPKGKALNFWGERDELPAEVCLDPETAAVMFAYSALRTLEEELPEVTGAYSELMEELGYDPADASRDKTTAIGLASSNGVRAAEWFAKDGWNSMGDLTRDNFQQRFEDYTGYTPVNSPWLLKYPLRWQPLVQPDFRPGRFNIQTHVFPYLGMLRPLVLTKEEVEARRVDPPYENMEATELSGKDAETMDFLVKELFNVSANLTPEQRFFGAWWDIKLTSSGFFTPIHSIPLRLTPLEFNRMGLGDAMAQYDAAILAWKEKRRVDAVRPVSIIRKFYKDLKVTAYVSERDVQKRIKAGDWEPLIPIQPHSEFPSASASICQAFAEHGTYLMKELVEAKGLEKEPPFIVPVDPETARIGPKEVTLIKFDTYAEAGESCAQSRVWAGVHFQPSVPAGQKLAEGVGKMAYEFAKKLATGVVPEECWWCSPS